MYSLVDLWINCRNLIRYIFTELDFWTRPVQNRICVSHSYVLTKSRCGQAPVLQHCYLEKLQDCFSIEFRLQTGRACWKAKSDHIFFYQKLFRQTMKLPLRSLLCRKKNLSIVANYINCLSVKQADKYEQQCEFLLVPPSAEFLEILSQACQITRVH